MPSGQAKTAAAKSIVGSMIGSVFVKQHLGSSKSRQAVYLFVCQCGKEFSKSAYLLRTQKNPSCGCLQATTMSRINVKHGNARRSGCSKEYSIWSSIKSRCENKNDKNYAIYGGRGVKMSSLWSSSFAQFFADMGKKPSPAHSIDRIDVDGDYEPGNCRWATQEEQCQNKTNNVLTPEIVRAARIKKSEGASVKSIARFYGIHPATIAQAIRRYTWANIE